MDALEAVYQYDESLTDITYGGSGSYGVVYLCKRNGERIALKMLQEVTLCYCHAVPIEACVLIACSKIKGIVDFYNFNRIGEWSIMEIQTWDNVMDLERAVNKSVTGYFTEERAAKCFRQILDVVYELNSMNLIHGDLASKNVLLNVDDNYKAYLIDFGLAKKCKNFTGWQGTIDYSPPELVTKRQYDWEMVQVYGLGCLLYFMLHSYTPFHTKEEVLETDILYIRGDLSREVKVLLNGCLQFYPDRRYSMKHIYDDQFVWKYR